MALLSMNLGFGFDFTPLPNTFIEKYMPKANPVFSIVYIFAFKNCFFGSDIDTKEISNSLGIIESDVYKAFEYWEENKLINLSRVGDDLEIEFLEIAEEDKKVKKEIQFMETKPNYSVQEIEIYAQQSKDIKSIFDIAEKGFGRYLTHMDMSILFGFYDWLRLPIPVIEKIINYCCENGHNSIRYMEKVAMNWADENINTVKKAEDYVFRFNTEYRQILRAFGISGRDPGKTEIEYMKKWLDVDRMPLPLILEACDRTLSAVHNANFKYTNSIVTKWVVLNIKTLEEAQKESDEHKENNENNEKTKKLSNEKKRSLPATSKKNRIVNYKGRTWDYEKLEKLEQERIINSVKGL